MKYMENKDQTTSSPAQESKFKKYSKLILLGLFILALLLSNAISFAIGYWKGDMRYSTEIFKTTEHVKGKSSTSTPENLDFEAFWKAWTILDKKFVENNDEQKQDVTDEEKLW